MLKGLVLVLMATVVNMAIADQKSICGEEDDRILSFNPKVGRSSEIGEIAKGCTVTMINDTCAISAGHCEMVLHQVAFNTPISIQGEPQASAPEDIYEIDRDTLVYKDDGPGKDWAVFKVKANKITGKLPGQVQGYYDVNLKDVPTEGTIVRITGYGTDRGDMDSHYAQQVNTGPINSIGTEESRMGHAVDTMGGNSGSSIINEKTQEIIGIHTHGGCNWYGSNQGTVIALNENVKTAIKACLNK